MSAPNSISPEQSLSAPDSASETPQAQQEPAPMLDVHPAHHAASTWRDFFIHIATIVIGLLIAVGLEQTVEYFHHRHLAHEARRLLLQERISNESSNDFNIYTTQRHQRDLLRDLAILRAVRAHQPRPNQPFIVRRFRYVYLEDEWRKIHQSGTVNYLTEKLGPIDYRYFNQDAFLSRVDESTEALLHASAMLRGENDSPLEFESSLADTRFTRALADSHETLNEEAVQEGYASRVEHADLSKLTGAQLDELEAAIKIGLVDDDALMTYCFNIKRNLQNNPVKSD
jgi:hypothetical protein